jgi:2-polyprenyl-3-methyl-5-hydroxy-6-metoxy-1,4-benzoquinol methylase
MPQFQNDEFDIVFSNSVIEHVGSYEEQNLMASEVRRVGKRYFIQTPNLFFPIEPHFLFPFFQFLPLDYRVTLIIFKKKA